MPILDPTNVVFEETGQILSPTEFLDFTDHTIGTSDFTIESWINFTSAASESRDYNIVEHHDVNESINNSPYWQLAINTGSLRFQTLNAANIYSTPTNNDWFEVDRWYHVAVMRYNRELDGRKTLSLYIDGTQVFQSAPSNPNMISYNIPGSAESITIGGRKTSTPYTYDTNYDFPGTIQDVRVITQVKYETTSFTPTPRTVEQSANVTGDPHITTFSGVKYTL